MAATGRIAASWQTTLDMLSSLYLPQQILAYSCMSPKSAPSRGGGGFRLRSNAWFHGPPRVRNPNGRFAGAYQTACWWRGTVVERRSLAGELSLSCARPAADG